MVTETATRNLSYIQAVNEALRQEMRRDPAVFVMGEDVAGGAGREDQGIIDSWGGPMRLTKGLITEFGAGPRSGHANLRGRVRWSGRRSGGNRTAARR